MLCLMYKLYLVYLAFLGKTYSAFVVLFFFFCFHLSRSAAESCSVKIVDALSSQGFLCIYFLPV